MQGVKKKPDITCAGYPSHASSPRTTIGPQVEHSGSAAPGLILRLQGMIIDTAWIGWTPIGTVNINQARNSSYIALERSWMLERAQMHYSASQWVSSTWVDSKAPGHDN